MRQFYHWLTTSSLGLAGEGATQTNQKMATNVTKFVMSKNLEDLNDFARDYLLQDDKKWNKYELESTKETNKGYTKIEINKRM